MFLKLLRGAASTPEIKSSAVGKIVAMQNGGRAAWTPRDAVSLTRSGYLANAVAFRCVRMVAEAAAAIPLCLKDGARSLAAHPLLTLLNSPNAGQDGAGMLEAVYGHLLLHGDAYLEAAALDDAGAPSELHALRPDRMTVIPGFDGWPEAFEYKVGGRAHRFDMTTEAQPVLHLRGFHPLDDHYGMAPLAAAAMAIELPGSIQNGSPDGLRITKGAGASVEFIDGLAYEGWMEGVGEGDAPAARESNSGLNESISRCGVDSDDNSADFQATEPTPGLPNACR